MHHRCKLFKGRPYRQTLVAPGAAVDDVHQHRMGPARPVGRPLEDVENLARPAIVSHLFVMAVSLSIGSLVLGAGAHLLRKRGVRAQDFMLMFAGLFVVAELALILGSPASSYVLLAIVASLGGASVLTYAILPEFFSTNMIGQANAVLKHLPHCGCVLSAMRDRFCGEPLERPRWTLSSGGLSGRICPHRDFADRSNHLVCLPGHSRPARWHCADESR